VFDARRFIACWKSSRKTGKSNEKFCLMENKLVKISFKTFQKLAKMKRCDTI